jgi:hypothetical protein
MAKINIKREQKYQVKKDFCHWHNLHTIIIIIENNMKRKRESLMACTMACTMALQPDLHIIAVMLATFAAVTVVLEDTNGRSNDRIYDIMDWEKEVAFLTPVEFKRMYRMELHSFNILLEMIRESLITDSRKLRKGVLPVTPELKLAITLRFLAGGNVNDLWRLYGVSVTQLYVSVWATVDAINKNSHINIDFSDRDQLQQIESGFAAKSSRQLFRGCIGAIDGIQVKVSKPSIRDGVLNPREFFCRKGFYSINVQAVCDSDWRFLDIDIRWPGSTSDTMAWMTTDVYKAIQQKIIPDGFFFVGDAAYPCSKHMLTPVPGNVWSIGRWADSYNFRQSPLRINVECAFGLFMKRWGIMWKPLECSFKRAPAVFKCCVLLHNFCIDQRVSNSFSEEALLNPGDGCVDIGGRSFSMRPRFDKNGVPVELLSSIPHRNEVENVTVRDIMIDKMQEYAQLRPPILK